MEIRVLNCCKRSVNAGYSILMVCLLAVTCWAQTDATPGAELNVLLQQLRSDHPFEREHAFNQLRSKPEADRDPKVRQALLELLDRENKALEAENRTPPQPDTPKQRDVEEGDAEYLGQLGGLIDTFADWSNPRQVCIFVHEAYNPDSEFGAKIAAHARLAVPCLLQMANSDIGAIRAEAIPTLVQALAKGRREIETGEVALVQQQIVKGLHDQDAVVQGETVIALGAYGASDMIPALEDVARFDPGSETRADNGTQWFPIREEAEKAITQIRQRQGEK